MRGARSSFSGPSTGVLGSPREVGVSEEKRRRGVPRRYRTNGKGRGGNREFTGGEGINWGGGERKREHLLEMYGSRGD